tara:strand:+ start:12463 stop:13527 length:1065 start_codon:yes stop_codon:yes gene_type:complete
MMNFVKKPVTLYTADDVDAPNFNTVNGEFGTPLQLFEMFKQILVDGYGTGANFKEPMGWTLVEYKATIPDASIGGGSYVFMAVFRNASGTTYLELSKGTSVTDDFYRTNSKIYFSAHAWWNSYTDKAAPMDGDSTMYLGHTSASSQASKFVFVGNEDAFVFFMTAPQRWGSYYNCSSSPSLHGYVGDYNYATENDPVKSLFLYSNTTGSSSYNWNSSWVYTMASVGYYQPAGLEFVGLDGTGASRMNIIPSPISGFIGVENGDSAVLKEIGATCNLHIRLGTISYNMTAAANAVPNTPYYRGSLRGLEISSQPMCADHDAFPIPNIQTFDGVKYCMWPSINTGISLCWINCEEW